MKKIIFNLILLLASFSLFAKKDTVINMVSTQEGLLLEISFVCGRAHNHPLYAIWMEDLNGNYIQTLYVSESIGKGIFTYGDQSSGKWLPGEILRPAALPHWAHQRGVKNKQGTYLPTSKEPIADAYTGATPKANFILQTKTDKPVSHPFKIKMEINQSWDWNHYWTNHLYPDDEEYKTSCQPALVYEAVIKPENHQKKYVLKLVGHSHYSGKDGRLNPDLSTITTAKKIAKKITVSLERR